MGALSPETIDPLADPRWQSFLERSPGGGIFHHVQWLRLLREQYGYSMRAHCVTDGEGEIVAGLPFARVRSRLTGKRLVALPFSDVCAPVLAGGAPPEALALLLRTIRAAHERERVDVEIRATFEPPGGDGGSCERGESFYRHELALGCGVEAVRGGFTKMAIRGVDRAAREGVEVVRAGDREALEVFYRLHLATRRRQGVPTQPRRFVARFADLFERELGFVLIARSQGTPIAAAVFLEFNGVLTYKYGASDHAHLKLRPNNAIFMEAIRWGCGRGLHTLDLGRTDLENEGLRKFKCGWGAAENELAYTLLRARAARLPRGEGSARAARPGVPPLLKTLISRTPPVTGRLVGAALYRHFG